MTTWQLQHQSCKNSAGVAPCISIVWSIKQWIGTRLCEHLIKSIMTSSSKLLFLRNQDSKKWFGTSKLATWQLQNYNSKINVWFASQISTNCSIKTQSTLFVWIDNCKISVAKTMSVLRRAFHSFIPLRNKLAHDCPNMSSSLSWLQVRQVEMSEHLSTSHIVRQNSYLELWYSF